MFKTVRHPEIKQSKYVNNTPLPRVGAEYNVNFVLVAFDSGGGSSKILSGTGDENFGVKGEGYALEYSSVWANLFTAYGDF